MLQDRETGSINSLPIQITVSDSNPTQSNPNPNPNNFLLNSYLNREK